MFERFKQQLEETSSPGKLQKIGRISKNHRCQLLSTKLLRVGETETSLTICPGAAAKGEWQMNVAIQILAFIWNSGLPCGVVTVRKQNIDHTSIKRSLENCLKLISVWLPTVMKTTCFDPLAWRSYSFTFACIQGTTFWDALCESENSYQAFKIPYIFLQFPSNHKFAKI